MKQKPSSKPIKPPEKLPDYAPQEGQSLQEWLSSLPKGGTLTVELPPRKVPPKKK